MVEVFDDRVDIVNPGGLPKGFKTENFGRVSIRRNERIADLFFRMDKGERAGTGIRRMNEAMETEGCSQPEIKYDEMFFFISFKRPISVEHDKGLRKKKETVGVTERVTEKVTVKVTDNQSGILREMMKDKYTTAVKLSKNIGISERKIKENIRILKNRGLIQRIGPDKGGHWEVNNAE